MKTLFLFLFAALVSVYAQNPDSINIDYSKSILDSLTTLSSDSTTVSDTTGLLSTKKNIAKMDTVTPLHNTQLFSKSDFIGRREYLMNDYRYSANIIQNYGFSFLADRGFIGQPNELYLFGIGNSGISYLEDGVLINSRISNQYDLNNFMSEQIDSVEIIPLPRGFLYGPFNNPVSVNLITKDLIFIKPFTKIKYYQGADGEALIDALFNSIIFKKFILTVDISNRKFDSTYINSDYSLWQGNFKLKYLLSNKINLSGNYSIVDSKLGMNNGVDVDSILKTTSDYTTTLYDNLTAPVLSPFLRQNVKQHNFRIGMLGKLLDSSLTKLNLYYRFALNERNYQARKFTIQNKDYTFGANLEQEYSNNLMTAMLLINFEKSDVQSFNYFPIERFDYKIKSTSFSIAPIFSFPLFNKKIIPSVFYKFSTSTYDRDYLTNLFKNKSGFGFDIIYRLDSIYNFYAGYSTYKYFNEKNFKSIEFGADIKFRYLYANASIFSRNSVFTNYDIFSLYNIEPYYYYYTYMNGINLKLNLNLKPLLLESQTTYYYNYKNSSELLSELPKINFIAGIYYSNILFKNNLNLKTGFKFYYNGEMKSQDYNYYYWQNLPFATIPSSWHVDFTLVGEIQKAAYVYFTWENILGKNFYIVPYYPMRGRNLRFGVSWELFN